MRQVILLLLLVSTNVLFSQSNEVKKVKKCFKKYKNAILEDRGDEAADVVSKATIDYYQKMLDIALTADSATVDQLGITDKMTVLTVRHKVPKSTIAELDGRGFFIYAISAGMVGKNSVINATIGEVKVNENFATGQLLVNGQESPMYFHFYHEGDWKLDLTSLFHITNTALNQMVQESGMSQNEFLFQILQSLTGRYPNSTIWQPMN